MEVVSHCRKGYLASCTKAVLVLNAMDVVNQTVFPQRHFRERRESDEESQP